jgi:hypothetical protein
MIRLSMIRLLGGGINASDDLRNRVVLRPEDGVHELSQFAIATDKRGPKREPLHGAVISPTYPPLDPAGL